MPDSRYPSPRKFRAAASPEAKTNHPLSHFLCYSLSGTHSFTSRCGFQQRPPQKILNLNLNLKIRSRALNPPALGDGGRGVGGPAIASERGRGVGKKGGGRRPPCTCTFDGGRQHCVLRGRQTAGDQHYLHLAPALIATIHSLRFSTRRQSQS